MQRSETLSAYILAPFEKVWNFISNPENLHLWTVDFALAQPQKVGDIYKVQTPRGERDLYVKGNEEWGVIDFYFGTGGKYGCSPSRLIKSGDGIIYIFTQFEPMGAPPGLFETLVGNVKKELIILKDLLEPKEKTQP
jgi:hypothetical protein